MIATSARTASLGHALIGCVEPLLDEPLEELGLDRADLHHLRAPIEGLVLVVEQAPHHVALAAGVDVGDVGLLLEDGTHECRQPRVDVRDLLELVEVERDRLLLLGRQLRR